MPPFRTLLAIVAACALLMGPPPAKSADIPVDLKLVLAVDISYSMDGDELKLQRDGYVSAFRHPEILAAIRSGRHRRIAVVYLEWAGASLQFVRVPWQLIDSDEAAEYFAARLETQPLQNARRTSMSGALDYAADLFDANGYNGTRQVIDISGDGANNSGLTVEAARNRAVARGITINGLPLILRPAYLSGFSDAVELNDYYRDCVIGGFGSFLITVENISEITLAIRQKLILEMAARQLRVILASHTREHPKVDCLIGEKLSFDEP